MKQCRVYFVKLFAKWLRRALVIIILGVLTFYLITVRQMLSNNRIQCHHQNKDEAYFNISRSSLKQRPYEENLQTKKNEENLHIEDRKAFLTIGIPTVCRENGTYIKGTLQSLTQSLKQNDLNEIIIIVLLCDLRHSCREKIRRTLTESFHNLIKQKILNIMEIPKDYYPSLKKLKRTFNDSEDRVKWRSKQNLDYSFIMDYSKFSSKYYLQLEDDVTAAPHYFTKIKEYIAQIEKPWAMLEFSTLGFIGKLFHSEDVGKLAALLRTFYNEQPCDFLISYFLHIMLQNGRFIRIPTLFQHNGLHSSLSKLVRNVTDNFYIPVSKQFHGDNPPASIFTSMSTWQNYRPENAYLVEENDVFWSTTPVPGATYTIIFNKPQKIKRIAVQTGLSDKHSDKLKAGILEISSTLVSYIDNDALCTGYQFVAFFKNGTIDADTNSSIKTKCVRITLTARQDTWLVMREIAVFVKQ